MKALEAKKLSESNAMPLDKIYEQIEGAAKYGNKSHTFFNYISQDKIGQLMADGYKISSFIDPIGMEGVKIEW